MSIDEQRSFTARQRAEQALIWLLHRLAGQDLFIVVLGGLVPEVLTRGQEPPVPAHLGTVDVDVLLIAHVEPGTELVAVERALAELDFESDPTKDGWRWSRRIDGHPVQLEFLCDLDTVAEGQALRPAGCAQLAAANLRGTGYVARDFSWETLTGTLPDGTAVSVGARFAGLDGYLLAKCVATRTRAADKDYYDLAYVLLHNRLGGPVEAAQSLREGALADALPALRTTFLELRERFRGPLDDGPRRYAESMRLVDPSADEVRLRADAVYAAAVFFDGLGVL